MITLKNVLSVLTADNNLVSAPQDDTLCFEALSYDSRQATDKTLFFAKGDHFKKDYLSALIAPVYVSEVDYGVPLSVILVSNIQRAMSLIAQAFYDYPQNKLKLLAFTGTKGKTTSAYFAKSILDEMNGGQTAMLSTAYNFLDGKTAMKAELTTPESLDLFQMMATAVTNGMTHFVMEVSSQAYLRQRVYGLTYDVGVFLNISPDHIGPLEHPTFENYFYCKRQLLKHSRYIVANFNMDHFDVVEKDIGDTPHSFYGICSPNQIVVSSAFDFATSGDIASQFHINLLGSFNQNNALAAALATKHLGASLKNIQEGLKKTIVPGRMEIIKLPNGADIYIDYAHNGISLENLIDVVEEHHRGTILLVLGATGNKGESRRKDFGKIIERHPRLKVALTTDDSNYEDPEAIANEISSYVTRQLCYIGDREEAIRASIRWLVDPDADRGPDDALIIAGKGEDHFQLLRGVRVPYIGDKEAAERHIQESFEADFSGYQL